MGNTTDILKKHGLSKTESRTAILDIFLKANGAISNADIEKKAPASFDRVTVYRTLQSFTDKGIIHEIPTTNQANLYALCKDECDEKHHHDDHVHFVCSVCDGTTCLEEVLVPTVKLPSGFTRNSSSMNVYGICKKCKS